MMDGEAVNAGMTIESPHPARERSHVAARAAVRTETQWIGLLSVVSLMVIAYRLIAQIRFGPGWDAYAFLLNALDFAGQGNGYLEIYRPPMLPALASLLIRAGFDAPWITFAIDGLFTLAGVIGLYLLVRRVASPAVSSLGALAFLAAPDTVENLTAGLTDLMSVAISIWLVYFVVRALRDDPAYMCWAVLLVPLGFITRFTAGLMLAVIVMAVLYDGRLAVFIRPIARGIAWSTALLVPYLAWCWWRMGDPLIQFGEPLRAATATSQLGMLSGNIEPSTYFLTNFPRMLGSGVAGWALAGLVVLGIGTAIADSVLRRPESLHTNRAVFLGVSFAAACVLTIGPTTTGTALAAWIVVLGVLVPRLLARRDDGESAIVAIVLFWLALYATFHSHMLVKVPRYYVTMLPAAVFFLAYLIERVRRAITARAGSVISPAYLAGLAVTAVLIATAMLASFDRLEALAASAEVTGYPGASAWVATHVPARGVRMASDDYTAMRYQLRRLVYPMPPTRREATTRVARWLDAASIDYFVTAHEYPPIPGFEVVHRSGDIWVWKRVDPAIDRGRVYVVGRGVDKHINAVVGMNAPYVYPYLNVIPDDWAGTQGAWIDDFSLVQLLRYDALYLYRFHWHDQARAEAVIRAYARVGRTVIIDASGNLGTPPTAPNGLENISFLDVMITREPMPAAGRFTISEPSLLSSETAPALGRFTSEEGGPWYAAAYAPLGPARMRTLASYAGRPIVFEERVGRGRIIWVGGNLGFHAYLRGTPDERAFVRNLLGYATDWKTRK